MEFSVTAKALTSYRLALLKGNMQQVSRRAFHYFIIERNDLVSVREGPSNKVPGDTMAISSR
jgi:hypothetical protein